MMDIFQENNKTMIWAHFLLVCIIAGVHHVASTRCTKTNYMEVYIDYNRLEYTLFSGFVTFDEMWQQAETCGQTYKLTANENSGVLLEFLPKRPLIIDNSFNTIRTHLLTSVDISQVSVVIFQNLKGIENSNHIAKQFDSLLTIALSKLDFYLNKSLIKETECDRLVGADGFFASFRKLVLASVKFPTFLCPTILGHSPIDQISIDQISNSLINKNQLRFVTIPNSLPNQVTSLNLELAYAILNSQLLNRQMFIAVTSLEIRGVLAEIESDLLMDFRLKVLQLNIQNMRDFFHRGNNVWLTSLNAHLLAYKLKNLDIRGDMMLVRFGSESRQGSFNRDYDYPDADFCLFKHFPHERLVFPSMIFDPAQNCSCTMSFLVQHAKLVAESQANTEFNFYAVFDFLEYNYLSADSYNALYQHCSARIQVCNFANMLVKCNRTQSRRVMQTIYSKISVHSHYQCITRFFVANFDRTFYNLVVHLFFFSLLFTNIY